MERYTTLDEFHKAIVKKLLEFYKEAINKYEVRKLYEYNREIVIGNEVMTIRVDHQSLNGNLYVNYIEFIYKNYETSVWFHNGCVEYEVFTWKQSLLDLLSQAVEKSGIKFVFIECSKKGSPFAEILPNVFVKLLQSRTTPSKNFFSTRDDILEKRYDEIMNNLNIYNADDVLVEVI